MVIVTLNKMVTYIYGTLCNAKNTIVKQWDNLHNDTKQF